MKLFACPIIFLIYFLMLLVLLNTVVSRTFWFWFVCVYVCLCVYDFLCFFLIWVIIRVTRVKIGYLY